MKIYSFNPISSGFNFLFAYASNRHKMDRTSYLVLWSKMFETKQNWFIWILKCLNPNQMFGSMNCMSQTIDLSNFLLLTVHFRLHDAYSWKNTKLRDAQTRKTGTISFFVFRHCRWFRSTITEWILNLESQILNLNGKNLHPNPSRSIQVSFSPSYWILTLWFSNCLVI